MKYVERYLENYRKNYLKMIISIDQHCMHTCFASSLRNTNGEFHLTLTCLTYAIEAGNLDSLYSST